MKPKSKKALIIITGLAAVSAGIYFIFKDDDSPLGEYIRKITGKDPKMENSSDEDDTPSKPPTTTPSSGTGCSSYVSESFPLKKCMKGVNVERVQEILNRLYLDKIGAKISVDKKFGPGTEAALIKATGKKELTIAQYNSLISATAAKVNLSDNDEEYEGSALAAFFQSMWG